MYIGIVRAREERLQLYDARVELKPWWLPLSSVFVRARERRGEQASLGKSRNVTRHAGKGTRGRARGRVAADMFFLSVARRQETLTQFQKRDGPGPAMSGARIDEVVAASEKDRGILHARGRKTSRVVYAPCEKRVARGSGSSVLGARGKTGASKC